jgi:16S rRNA (cytidine1402-2'-O)-methyltransferase
MQGVVYLLPTVLYDDALETIPAYVTQAVQQCTVFFVENEKTARRYLKKLWREMVIDNYRWFAIHKAEQEVTASFIQLLKAGERIGIISEAGCPGVADPGQLLVHAAQQAGFTVKPLVGPNSILLALMASGMNGQCFQFNGYLPIDTHERKKKIKELESDSYRRQCTHIFIETPYRNNQLVKDVLQTCKNDTRFCMAVNITAPAESIKTLTVGQWQRQVPDIHKQLAVFLLQAFTV